MQQNLKPQAVSKLDRLAAARAHAAAWLGHDRWHLEPASADASFRRYFRIVLNDGGSFIVMDAPPPQENCRPFVRIARAFRQLGLNVPEVLQEDLEQGFLLLTDLGVSTYLPVLNSATVDRLYADATASIFKLHTSQDDLSLPPYDHARLRREVNLFHEWFLTAYLGFAQDALPMAMIEQVYEAVIDSALQQPQVVVHRDFHSRNLILNEENNPGVLDFQDAVFGPITYDLVSLFRDCYIDWPQPQIYGWLEKYRLKLQAHGLLPPIGRETFQYWFDLMGMQRHLKCVGIFSRLSIRDGKTGYLKDIPRTFHYIVEVIERQGVYPDFAAFIRQTVQPALQRRQQGGGAV